MEKSFTVLTAIGADRVGIVDDLSGVVVEEKCNIEESKMAVLGGEFAVIMLVSGAAQNIESLSRSLSRHGERLGLRLECKGTRPPRPVESGRPYLLEAVSLDTPGIVHSVTAAIRSFGINIEDLETDTAAAPWTGAPMFRMKAHIVVPPSVPIGRLKAELGRLQESQDLDITLKPMFAAAPETD